MEVPTLPHEALVDDDRVVTKPWENYFQQTQQNMQQSISNEGFLIPSQATSNIAMLTQSLTGTLIFDSSLNVLKININGVWYPITLGFPWNVIAAASTQMLVNNGYIGKFAGITMLIMPTTSAVGNEIKITEAIAGGSFLISQGAGQTIYVGNSPTTTGVGGSIQSTQIGDGISMVCTVANTEWYSTAVVGNLTIV